MCVSLFNLVTSTLRKPINSNAWCDSAVYCVVTWHKVMVWLCGILRCNLAQSARPVFFHLLYNWCLFYVYSDLFLFLHEQIVMWNTAQRAPHWLMPTFSAPIFSLQSAPWSPNRLVIAMGKLKRVVWYFEERDVVLWRGWCGTLKSMVWYFEERGVVLWRGWYGYLKSVVWYFEESGVVRWYILVNFTATRFESTINSAVRNRCQLFLRCT